MALKNGDQPKLQYKLYSAHDTQIANILRQLAPDYNFTYVKYASQIYMEAYSQPEGDILVRTLYNGVALKYP